MSDLIEIAKIAVPLLLGALGTWLAQRLKPRPEKQKEETSAQRADWELWRDQFAWAKQEILDLRKQCEQQETSLARLSAEMSALERRHAELLVKHADLEQRQDDMQAHVEDLWQAIGQEPDGGKAISDRLKTQRPAARGRAKKKEGEQVGQSVT